MSLKDATKIIQATGKAIDDNTESGEERQQQLTERLKIDMGSDNKLSKSIRPITLIFLLLLEGFIVVTEGAFGFEIDVATKTQVGLLLGAALGFYFDSKKQERIAQKNASANIQLEKIRVKAEIKEKRRLRKKNERTTS